MNKHLNASLSGEYGGTYFSDTSAHTGNWSRLQCLTACTFSAITGNIASFPTAVAIAAGTVIQGRFTALTLTSGTLIAYNDRYA